MIYVIKCYIEGEEGRDSIACEKHAEEVTLNTCDYSRELPNDEAEQAWIETLGCNYCN